MSVIFKSRSNVLICLSRRKVLIKPLISKSFCAFPKYGNKLTDKALACVPPKIYVKHVNVKASSFTQKNMTDEFRLIYEGPLSRKIKLIKLFSISTATMSLVAAPILILRGKESVPFIGKMILATTVITMGVTTTLLLHWMTRVYVHKMFFHPQTRTFAAETSNLIGRSKTHTFTVADMVIPEIESAFSTFEANGQKFFIHMDLKEAEQIMKYVREYNTEELS